MDENEIQQDQLEKFILNNPDLEKLELMLSDFNLFETLELVNAEIRHSNVLAWLLNPRENHGAGPYFLNLFLKHFLSQNKSSIEHLNVFDIEMLNYADVEIRREWRNIDILIIIKDEHTDLVITIENKIGSSEHSNQLNRYREIVEQEFKSQSKLFVFLTPDSTIPSDDNWVNFNYTTVAELVDRLIHSKKDALHSNIITFIEHYYKILKRHIVGNSEVEIICKQIYKKHKDALDLIFQYKPDEESEVSNYIQSIVNADPDLHMDSYGKSVVRFTTSVIESKIPKICEGWTKYNSILAYEFTNHSHRLVLRLLIGPGDQKTRSNINKYVSQNPDLFKLAIRNLGKKWHCVYQKEFIKKKDYQSIETSELQQIFLKKWEEFCTTDRLAIDEHIKGWNENLNLGE